MLYTWTGGISTVTPKNQFLFLKDIYSEMLNRLSSNDTAAAMSAFTESAANKYQPAFGALGAGLSTAVNRLGLVDGGTVASDFGELSLTRQVGTDANVFPIYFLRGADGIWRIDGM